MPTAYPNNATSVFFSCIDARLVQPGAKFMASHGNSFHPAIAGGAKAIIDETERAVALKQIVAAYLINHISTVYIESHTGCGAYKLAGVTFESETAEIERLFSDLDEAVGYVEAALLEAGAKPGEITIYTRVVNPLGEEQSRPVMQEAN